MLTEPGVLELNFHVFEGSTDILSGLGHSKKIVLHLSQETLGIGYAVYIDNIIFITVLALLPNYLTKIHVVSELLECLL